MSDDATFGPLVLPDEVEGAVIATLKRWLPEYLAWVERKTGRTARSLKLPQSYVPTSDLTRWPEEGLPSVLVMNTGLSEEPTREKDRQTGITTYRAKFALGLAVVVGAKDQDTVDALSKLYTAIIRTVLLHKRDLGGFADAVEWVDEGYDALPADRKRRRQLAAGQAIFRVEVPDLAAAMAGPREPRDNPYTPYPDGAVVLTHEEVVVPEEL